MFHTPTASYSITVRARITHKPGMFARMATVIGEEGGLLGAIDLVEAGRDHFIRDITVAASDEKHAQRIVHALKGIPGIHVIRVADRTFLMHLGGKLEIAPLHPVRSRDDLSMTYTPGVARICQAIQEEPDRLFTLTIKRHTVAVVSDGSAVLGLGNLGPGPALPVMEGKAVLFKIFGNVDAFPICLATQDTDEMVRTIHAIAPVFGGINLEDIAAPRCFEVEERLQESLDIPVFHDDQHGTAVVLLAGLINALKIVGKAMPELKVVISGAGAAGTAIAGILLESGARRVVVCDRAGAVYQGRSERMNPRKERLAAATNPERERGGLADVLRGADVFLGVSEPGMVSAETVRTMASDPIVFALANPEPEVHPEEVSDCVRVMATGRSDYPNQINNVLCFPGLFHGVLDCRARSINMEMKVAAAEAIAGVVTDRELNEEYIVPSVFNRKVADVVSRAVIRAAVKTGLSRREPRARWAH